MTKPLSYIEISKPNLTNNFQAFRSFIHPETAIVCVVKGNAYGHGQSEVAALLDQVVDYFQVDDFQELESLRKITQKPILVLGYVAKNALEEAIRLNGIISIYDEERLHLIDKIAKDLGVRPKVHIKIDASLGRQGILLDEVGEFANSLKQYEHIEVDGVYAHFANIEDTTDFSHAQKQIDAFDQAIRQFEENGFKNLKRHISATSGILAYDKAEGRNDIVRLGIGLYGMWPSPDLRVKYENNYFTLKPIVKWVTHVAQVKTVPANYSIGYGLTFVTAKPTTIAIIPQGYSDGYDRGLSNTGEVLIQGKRCPVLGRVAMNMFAVDVSHLAHVNAEEEVVLIGDQGEERITAEEIADKINTINYEVTARISPLLPRIISE